MAQISVELDVVLITAYTKVLNPRGIFLLTDRECVERGIGKCGSSQGSNIYSDFIATLSLVFIDYQIKPAFTQFGELARVY